jgi:glycosyltransferase involved in cell wall biosynthesis
VHAHFGSGGALALPIAKRRNLPLIVTFHGSDATMKDEWSVKSHFSQRLYLQKRKDLANYGRMFLAVSGFVKEKLVAVGFSEHKVQIYHIGIDPDFFQPVPLNREPLVVFVGRLEKNKGCDYLILAMAKVQQKSPNAELVVIGDGIERQRLENLAREVDCRCRFVGTAGPTHVKEWLNKAQVFCVPSVTAESGISEGFGLVFVEAQAMGVPVVSFRTGGIPEAVEDGVTGFLGKERDWEFLANKIRFLLENPDIRQRFAGAGRSRVCALFDLAKQARSLEAIYKRVASGTRSHESEMAGVVA